MVHLIAGYGEVGKSLHEVLGEALYADRKSGTWKFGGPSVDVLHICIPYKTPIQFVTAVNKYKVYSAAKLVIVHSTVPVGTCDALEVVHSPIRGVHPHLTEGIRTFPKYFGGKRAKESAKIFSDIGIKTRVYPTARTTEALKLWDTTQYGRLIMLEKEIHRWCVKNKIDFDAVYTQANKDYNKGYTKLGMPHVVRPYLKHIKGPIGGHCVVPNAKLLKVKL